MFSYTLVKLLYPQGAADLLQKCNGAEAAEDHLLQVVTSTLDHQHPLRPMHQSVSLEIIWVDYCRDGVSEGQFYQVLLYELDAIRKVSPSLKASISSCTAGKHLENQPSRVSCFRRLVRRWSRTISLR